MRLNCTICTFVILSLVLSHADLLFCNYLRINQSERNFNQVLATLMCFHKIISTSEHWKTSKARELKFGSGLALIHFQTVVIMGRGRCWNGDEKSEIVQQLKQDKTINQIFVNIKLDCRTIAR